MKAFWIAVILTAIVVIFGCMDMESENVNYNGEYPKEGTPEFTEIDTNADGVISDEEWQIWKLNQN